VPEEGLPSADASNQLDGGEAIETPSKSVNEASGRMVSNLEEEVTPQIKDPSKEDPISAAAPTDNPTPAETASASASTVPAAAISSQDAASTSLPSPQTTSSAAAPPSGSPYDWTSVFDPAANRYYFWNMQTGQVSWEPPASVHPPASMHPPMHPQYPYPPHVPYMPYPDPNAMAAASYYYGSYGANYYGAPYATSSAAVPPIQPNPVPDPAVVPSLKASPPPPQEPLTRTDDIVAAALEAEEKAFMGSLSSYDRGKRQLSHYFDYESYAEKSNAKTEKPKLTKKEVWALQKRKEEIKKKLKLKWLLSE